MTASQRHPASFRDPAGFVFEKDGRLYRQVNQVYKTDYQQLMQSGLYKHLVAKKMLVAHEEINQNFTGDHDWYTTIAPARLGFISFPYEWCFSQWKRAAMLTLDVQEAAIEHGMVLKDATPFNVQFAGTEPVFIDTLSFEVYDPSQPWVAYRQFMECFMAPLLLARYRSQEMPGLFALYPAGIPLALTARLLPWRCRFNLNAFLHVYLPGMIGAGKKQPASVQQHFTKQKLLTIVRSLQGWVRSLHIKSAASEWSRYYEETILSKAYADAKLELVKAWMKKSEQQRVLDLGTNTGLFALAAADLGRQVVAADADAGCIEALYRSCGQQANLLPLILDISKPTPAIGWMNAERSSFLSRIQPGLTLALALVHHLAIAHNISLTQLSTMFAAISDELIIEFVPKSDPKVQLLLNGRRDIFTLYDEGSFLAAFEHDWLVETRDTIAHSNRVLFYMKRRTL